MQVRYLLRANSDRRLIVERTRSETQSVSYKIAQGLCSAALADMRNRVCQHRDSGDRYDVADQAPKGPNGRSVMSEGKRLGGPPRSPPSEGSALAWKPVMLPPGCARLAAKPLPMGSDTDVNTIEIVLVSRARAPTTGVVEPKMALGRRSTSSFANVLILSGSLALQRSSIRRLLPSVHPSFGSA